jgi:UDP-N-acetylmuramoyl-tripeptide--D-alanyl-D-alanine ligase
LIIDDSYNGNPDGVEEAIRVLSEFKDRRKLFITPGLVEIGTETGSAHKIIGNTLAGVADRVLLVKNSATPYIEEGLLEKKFPKDSIIWFETAESLHANLGQIIRPNDVILFQNDWGDQYL